MMMMIIIIIPILVIIMIIIFSSGIKLLHLSKKYVEGRTKYVLLK